VAYYPEPVARLIEALQRLPGIGPKTAQRLTFFLLKRPAAEVRELAESLVAVKERILSCSTCFNVTDQDPCRICADPARDGGLLCVVEEPNDLLAMERTGEFRGRYHVLLGALSPLEGIGPKTAQRLTFFLLKRPADEVRELAESLVAVKERIVSCSTCFNVTDQDPCRICSDPARDSRLLCVVEEPNDLLAMERTGEYKGLYHVLLGALSPLDGIGPEDLRVRELLARLEQDRVEEVILATNPSVEGEATAIYLARLLKPLGMRITRIARGLPVGGDLEYADEVTLSKAMEGRREMG
jgi:recombination protein RecR